MGYGRLRPSAQSDDTPRSRKKLLILSALAITLIVASAICATLLIVIPRVRSDHRASAKSIARRPTQAISKTCSKTLYPALCIDSLLQFPGSAAAGEQDLVHISFNMTLQHLTKALYDSSGISYFQMDPRVRSAYDDCLELLQDSVDALSDALLSVIPLSGKVGSTQDVVTWLSAALTNQDTCTEGFDGVSGSVKDQMAEKLKDLSELVSNCLSIFASSGGDEFSGIPIQNRRRRLLMENFPMWLGKKERELLGAPASLLQADIVVSKDGNGTVGTIAEAIKKVPEHSNRRIVILVKAGRYEEENLKLGRKKTNVMFIGDGIGKTVITGRKSVSDGLTTFHTASFAATGNGFIARDMTFENYAGAGRHQAVALRVGADHAVVYRCKIIGYQDTLYVHSNRQFFRECEIQGTVDFIFGNAAVVLQNCTIAARKPMAFQKNTITAQNRKDPNQNTGISIHACRIVATSDLKGSSTYLGRPWKMYSRVVYMLSNMGDHIHPRGWLEWNSTFALDTLYYGEYMNTGPGSALGQRVKWPGYHIINSTTVATQFTVAQFIYGSAWLPSTGVAFLAGLQT